MKRLLATAALALSLTTTAYAGATATKIAQSGKWLSYIQNDGSVCGMYTTWPGNSRMLYVKYYDGVIHIHILKPTWRLNSGAYLKNRIQVDHDEPLEFTANTTTLTGTSLAALNITLGPDSTDAFLHDFEEADTFAISFPDGDEPDWIVSMEGSRSMSSVFKRCVVAKDNADANTTQPTGRKPTQPTKPVVKSKKDDGSV